MGKINGCLKCLFIFFNVVFAIFGVLLVVAAVRVSAYSLQVAAVGGPGLWWFWVFAVGMLALSTLGIYAAASEKDLPLKIFAGFMGLGMVIMMIFGIIVVVKMNQLNDFFRTATREIVKPIMEEEQLRKLLESAQEPFECCGVIDASDWGDDIPRSCKCNDFRGFDGLGGGRSCKARPQGATGPDQIYSQSCSEVLMVYVNLIFKCLMGFFFGFAVIALFGLLISFLMIHQVKRYDNAGGSSIPMKGY